MISVRDVENAAERIRDASYLLPCGVATASAGNLAYHAIRLGIRSDIVMPLHTPPGGDHHHL